MTPEEIQALQDELATLKAKLATMHEDAAMDALKAKVASAESAGTDALRAHTSLTAEADALRVKADALTAEKTSLTDALGKITAERDALAADRDKVAKRAGFTRDALIAGLEPDYLDVVTTMREGAPKGANDRDFLTALKTSKPRLFKQEAPVVAAPAADPIVVGNPARVTPLDPPPVSVDPLALTEADLMEVAKKDPVEYRRIMDARHAAYKAKV